MTRRVGAARIGRWHHKVEETGIMALAVLVVMGLMLLVAAAPAAGQVPATDDTVIQTSATNDAAGNQETYRSRVRQEMTEWRRKMQAFNAQTDAGGKRQVGAAETRLREAWNHTEIESRKVQVATAREWDAVTASYETASHELSAAWDKARL